MPMDILTAGTKARNTYEQICRGICQKYDINQSGMDVIMFLHAHPEQNTARDICTHRGLKSGLTSVILDQLIQKGYILRSDDAWDGRVKRLFLTEKATPLVKEGLVLKERLFACIGDGIDRDEMDKFWVMVERIIRNIEKMEKEFQK